jgi:predicted flap endonuclease-1-like 5' DNA nuclease
MDFIREYWPLILVAIVAAGVLLFLLFRPRQRVRLTESAPVRPHMVQRSQREPHGLAREAAEVTSDVAGHFMDPGSHRERAGSAASSDDFTRMKGVGPKFADALKGHGFNRFDQLAHLSPTEVERLDNELGAFRGRVSRDRVVEQADYLARGDIDGYEQRFGKL